MSYLVPPRLVFSGQFQADVSTVNNDPAHFDTQTFQPNYDLPGAPDGFTTPGNLGHQDGWWNPKGTGAWRFFNCSVTSATYRDGTTVSDASAEPVIGLPINATSDRVEGKLVDLDPEQQMVSEIWGFRVKVGGASTGVTIEGDFHTAAFADIGVRFPAGHPDSFFGAIYQSVLEHLNLSNTAGSRFLKELMETNPEQLSIKFNVDGLNDTVGTPTFTFGRVVGSIGLQDPTEPSHFVLGRQIAGGPLPNNQSYGIAYAQLAGSTLYVDLGNTIPTTSPGGPLAAQGNVYAALQVGTDLKILGQLPDPNVGWYQSTAGIASLALTADQATASTVNPLLVVASPTGNAPYSTIASDAAVNPQTTAPCQFIRADQYVYRFNPGDPKSGSHQVDFYVTQYGERAPGQQISLAFDPSLMEGFINQGVPVSGPPVGTPTTALTWSPTTLTTDQNGKATLTVTSSDPGNPRVYIDGQVYGITYGIGTTAPAAGSVQNPSQILNALVFDEYAIPDQPNWVEHVQPIFQQYANLYPIMKPIVDLGNYASVLAKRSALKRVFSAKETDPNYMPVTRDLSAPKLKMLRMWLDNPVYMNLDSVEDLQRALQTAIELEHSTIPPYLTALYSIKPGFNGEVAELIRGIVMEEMLHMHLVANILIAIGGKPQIGQPGFVPGYPGSLPGGLRGDLTVSLRRCSIDQVRECFMSIEQPAKTAEPVRRSVRPHDPFDASKFTIGWFYGEILQALEDLNVPFGNLQNQVVDGEAFPILSLADATRAINEIILQGEGVGPLNPDDPDQELAHYYKFSEIVAGRRIVVHRDGFSYTGAPIAFDSNGVWPMMDNPDLAAYPTGSRAQVLGMQFAQTYQALLDALNTTFNGKPERLNETVGLMYSLSLAARQLMQTPSGLNDGTTAGPVFQLPIPGLVTSLT